MLIQNYVKTAARNLKRNRFFTLLNVFCLALGMSISLLFVALLAFLFRFEDFHENRDRIYRVTTHVEDNEENPDYASAPAAIAQKLRENIAGIETVVPIQTAMASEVIFNEKHTPVYSYFTGPEFLQVFNFPLIKGNTASALASPNSVVITESEAKNIFGSKDPIGEFVQIEPYGDLQVTGVLQDIPKNSHMIFDVLVSYSTLASHEGTAFIENEESWTKFFNSYVYVLLSGHQDPTDVEHTLNKLTKEKYPDPKKYAASFELQPLTEIVPGNALDNPIGRQWPSLGLMLIGLTTMIILIPACANYVHLSISQSLKRMKEIGVRKVMGGQKKQIFFQFVMESMLTMLLALALSGVMFEAIRNEFLKIIGSETTDLTATFPTIIYFILFALLVGMVAGVSPALYFSKINPVRALKGKPEQTRMGGRITVRKVMITLQFILSLGFITSVVIMLQQYRYSVNYDFGFEQQNILDVELKNVDPKIFKNEYGKLSSIETISMSSHILGLEYNSANYIRAIGGSDSIESAVIAIDESFIGNLRLKLLAGKQFTENAAENAQFIIVNEELVKKLEIEDIHAAIGKVVVLPGGKAVHIGGVVKNFNYAMLTEPIGGLYFEYDPQQFRYANMKMMSHENVRDIAALEALWKKIGGDDKFTAQYFSEEVADAYSFYFEMIKIWGYLGLLAITVSCLGLLGTVVFTIKNRIKEVSIRKVVGASTEKLVIMLSKEFVILLVVASVITLPLVYIGFRDWLLPSIQQQNVEIGFLEIGVSLLIMSALGLSTILSQTIKAANANPVDNLKVE
ncbi:MAG TPA: ABC transporter permease [Chryseosolibacter sp.]|nr:ABC transporter permease [Chryseosolibacter sp.]